MEDAARRLYHQQQQLGDVFSFYRKGRVRTWDYKKRRSAIRRRQHPKQHSWPGTIGRDEELDKDNGARSGAGGDGGGGGGGGGGIDADSYHAWTQNVRQMGGEVYHQKAAAAARPLAEMLFERTGGRLRFNRILGYGGMGVIALFNTVNSAGAADEYFVVKGALEAPNHNTWEELKQEKKWHNMFKGAMHIVQSPELPMKTFEQSSRGRRINEEDEDYEPRAKRTRSSTRKRSQASDDKDIPEEDGFLMLEYCRRGDLHTALMKMQQSDEWVPDIVLWSMFKCLWKGCVAIAYPPKLAKNYEDGTIVDEKVRSGNPRCYVHFDLDPRNILLGDYDDDHPGVPIIKIGDFGLMLDMGKKKITEDTAMMWCLRQRGKQGWLTPEQFTAEWDHIKDSPAEADIAGQYSFKTNIFQIGQMMWCLITGCRPPTGPIARVWDDIWCYGHGLAREEHVDTDLALRRLVNRCMADDPDDRPDLRALGDAIEAGLKDALDQGQTYEMAREWSDKNLPSADPPPPRDPEDLQRWLDDQMSPQEEYRWIFGE